MGEYIGVYNMPSQNQADSWRNNDFRTVMELIPQ